MLVMRSLFQRLLWGTLVLAGIELALLVLATSGAVDGLLERFAQVTAAVALIAVAAAYVFSRGLAKRILALKAAAEKMLKEPVEIAQFESSDELGALAESLGKVAERLNEIWDKARLEGAQRDAILAGMVEGVLAVDRELRVTFCNASFARAFGATGEVPKGLPVLRLVRDPDFLEMLRNVIASGESLKRRLHFSTADGRSFEVQAAPLTQGAMAILHEITDLERLERVRKDFVANVSHELRTPLTAIRGYAETLLDGALDDPEHRRRFVEIIQSHAIRLNNIASDLLALSELESGKAQPEPGRLSIRETIEAAMRTVESEAAMRKVQLDWTAEDAYVLGNRIRLEQAFVNLLDNAIKFNRPGGEVCVEAKRIPVGNITIVIADNGIGIPSEDVPRIFERFYRVDKARSRDVGGTGLGLSIVKHVVEQMNGTVTVESQLGKGSRFTVTLPQS
jgi:two-component system phosphate regulon sensor histidine kinase PhoR